MFTVAVVRKSILLALCLDILCTCHGYFNVYLNSQEVERLFGVEAELFYVAEGIKNENALNFSVPIPARVNELCITWQSLTDQTLQYAVAVDVSNDAALAVPQLNISNTGQIPKFTQTVSFRLLCSGLTTDESDVTILINVTSVSNNVTSLWIHRKKMCSKAESRYQAPELTDSSLSSNSIKMFYVAVGFLILFVITFCVMWIASSVLNRKYVTPNVEVNNQAHTAFLPINDCSPTSNVLRDSLHNPISHTYVTDGVKDLQENISKLSVQRCRIHIGSPVLEGTFGRIYQGTYITDNDSKKDVIIKTVTDHASQIQISLLLQEGISLYPVTHANILGIFGVAFEENSKPLLMYPFQNFCNMKMFLQKCKLCSEGVAYTLTTQEVVDMSLQIVEAMQFLHGKHILHKDLAARNCVVDDTLKVRITDNALARDLFPADYHCLGDNENRPIKWLPMESLISKTFTNHSDVWSFGVLLWELTTLAQQPYADIDPFEMSAYLKDGYRLSQPINCPDELFAVMAYCWAINPLERPTFLQLQVCLKEFYAQLTCYI